MLLDTQLIMVSAWIKTRDFQQAEGMRCISRKKAQVHYKESLGYMTIWVIYRAKRLFQISLTGTCSLYFLFSIIIFNHTIITSSKLNSVFCKCFQFCRFEQIPKIGSHESVCLNDSCSFVVVVLIAVVMVSVVGLEEAGRSAALFLSVGGSLVRLLSVLCPIFLLFGF